MKHIYLSAIDVQEALKTHQITEIEAQRLTKKIQNQKLIYNSLHK